MTETSPGARAVATFEIEDVSLIESECKVARDFNPSDRSNEMAVFAHRVNVEANVLVQSRADLRGENAFDIVRYFFNVEVRLLKREIAESPPDPQTLTEDQIAATLRFVLALDYRAGSLSKDSEAIGAFSSNAQFHAWPYVREEIHAMCSRLRIPRLTVPMLRTQQRADGGHGLPTTNQRPVDT